MCQNILTYCYVTIVFSNQAPFHLNSQYFYDVCHKTFFLVLTDVHTWVDQKSKFLNNFLKLKTKGKKKPFLRDFWVIRSHSGVFLKIAVPS